MIDLFSTRELASGILLIIFFVVFLCNLKFRRQFFELSKMFFTTKLVMPLVIILLYGAMIIYLMQKQSFWEWKYLKDCLMWFFFVGIAMCYKAISSKYEEHYFKSILLDLFKFIVVVEFFVSAFTFHIVVELLLQVILAFLVIMQVITERKEEHRSVHKFFTVVITISMLAVLICTVKVAIQEYQTILMIDIAVSFVIPIILTIVYLPVVYSITLCVRYESVFLRMSFKEPQNRKIKVKNRIATIFICRCSIRRLTIFQRNVVPKMYRRDSTSSFKTIFRNYKQNMEKADYLT